MKICALKGCDNELNTGVKFCSKECFQKSNIGKPSPLLIPRERVICKTCKKVFYGVQYDKRKYCSNKCYSNAKKVVLKKEEFEEIKQKIREDSLEEFKELFNKFMIRTLKKLHKENI